MIVFYNYYAFRKCTGFWGFLSKRQRKSMISKHCQSTYHDTLRTFARKIFNIDFFLKILPLKDDELVMSEM